MLDTGTTPPPVDPTVPPTAPPPGAPGGPVFEPPLPADPMAPPGPTPSSSRQARPSRGGGGSRARRAPDPAPGPSSPPPPFVGGPPEPAREEAKGKGAAEKAAAARQAAQAVAVDPEQAAKLLSQLADGLWNMLAESRYGHMLNPSTGKRIVDDLAVTQQEKDAMCEALALFLKTSTQAVSPAANLAIAFGATYGVRGVMLEGARGKLAKARRSQAA